MLSETQFKAFELMLKDMSDEQLKQLWDATAGSNRIGPSIRALYSSQETRTPTQEVVKHAMDVAKRDVRTPKHLRDSEPPTANKRFKNFFDSFPRYGTHLLSAWEEEIIKIANKLATDKAKYYVEIALKEAAKKARVNVIPIDEEQWGHVPEIITSEDLEDNEGVMLEVDKESILNAYSIKKIK